MRRSVVLLLLAVVACGGPSGPRGEGKTAAERARNEHKASGEEPVDDKGKQWGGWRYRGSRDECFYVVGRTCFTDVDDACKAAKCKNGKKGAKACKVTGGGPATVSCKK
jgi:hypothetical protein